MSRAGDAEVVIVGGGAFGCAVAYFLARAGKRDVVLLEWEPARRAAERVYGDYYALHPDVARPPLSA